MPFITESDHVCHLQQKIRSSVRVKLKRSSSCWYRRNNPLKNGLTTCIILTSCCCYPGDVPWQITAVDVFVVAVGDACFIPLCSCHDVAPEVVFLENSSPFLFSRFSTYLVVSWCVCTQYCCLEKYGKKCRSPRRRTDELTAYRRAVSSCFFFS